jgi:hypothetical protein
MLGLCIFALGALSLEIRPEPAPDPTLRGELQRLGRRRMFFGHQSVGMNLLEGVRELAARCPEAGLRAVETTRPLDLPPGTLAHAFLPENGDPTLKLKHFEAALAAGGPEVADVAFVKFCYVDFTGDTDIPGLFAEYQAAMQRIRSAHPRTVIVHVTTPLTVVEAGPRGMVKRLLRRAPAGLRENARRDEFNQLLRRAYTGNEPVFDLALLECTAPDGRGETHRYNGHEIPALLPAYTQDGGHLNGIGRQRIARRLVAFLAALPERT